MTQDSNQVVRSTEKGPHNQMRAVLRNPLPRRLRWSDVGNSQSEDFVGEFCQNMLRLNYRTDPTYVIYMLS